MADAVATELLTAEVFFERYRDRHAELVAGEVREMAPPGMEHGAVAEPVMWALGAWNRETHAGLVIASESGFILSREPDTVRAPDGCFIGSERLPKPLPKSFAEIVPDLVLEVVSPGDRDSDVMLKVGEWLDAGVRVVWVLWPRSQTVWVCRAAGNLQVLSRADTLTSDDVLPGFALPLEEVFAVLDV